MGYGDSVALDKQHQNTNQRSIGKRMWDRKLFAKSRIQTKTKGNRDVDQLSNVDYVPTDTHSSQGESQLYIFEDNEAVIKMIIKGRSPTMRHVSRTHRVAIDWLFDRINLEPKIQIKYVETKNQLADMLTKGIFFVRSTLRISRFSFAAISVIFFRIRSGSRVPCQRANEFRRSRDPRIWCCTTLWVRGRTLCQIWAIPSIGECRKRTRRCSLASGNWCGNQAKIQSYILKWSDKKILKMQTLGNRKTGMNLRARLAPGNWCGRWTQRPIFRTWRSQTINTWQRFSKMCKKDGNYNK